MRAALLLIITMLMGCENGTNFYLSKIEKLEAENKQLQNTIERQAAFIIKLGNKEQPANNTDILKEEEKTLIVKHYSAKTAWLNEQRSAAMRDIMKAYEKCKGQETVENAIEYIKTFDEKTKRQNELKTELLVLENNLNARLAELQIIQKVPGLREDTSKIAQQYYNELKTKFKLK